MSRPTPTAIAQDDAPGTIGPSIRMAFLADLSEHGYVIVHPDDVPLQPDAPTMDAAWRVWVAGWNACRRHVVGDHG